MRRTADLLSKHVCRCMHYIVLSLAGCRLGTMLMLHYFVFAVLYYILDYTKRASGQDFARLLLVDAASGLDKPCEDPAGTR